jgi:hypothetical protein
MENLLEVEKVTERKLTLQEATLEAIKTIVDSTDKHVSYNVFNSMDRATMFGKENISKTHISITITDAMVDTTPRRI